MPAKKSTKKADLLGELLSEVIELAKNLNALLNTGGFKISVPEPEPVALRHSKMGVPADFAKLFGEDS